MKRTLGASLTDLIASDLAEVHEIAQLHHSDLNQPFATMIRKNFKDFVLINNEVYYRGSDGLLARALFLAKAREDPHCVHELLCGKDDASLYKQLRITGLKWTKVLLKYNSFVNALDVEESLFI